MPAEGQQKEEAMKKQDPKQEDESTTPFGPRVLNHLLFVSWDAVRWLERNLFLGFCFLPFMENVGQLFEPDLLSITDGFQLLLNLL